MKYSFTPYSEKQKKNWESSRSIVICETEEQIRKFVSDARKGTNIGKKMYLGAIPASLAETIRIETGLNVEGYNCSVAAQEIRKVFKDHGNEQTENLRGQRAITEYDFVNIPVVIQSPDKITRSDRDYNGRPVINFVKLLEGKVTVTAYVSGKHLDLTVQTMFAGKKNRNLATPTGEQAPANTPEANSGTVPENSIPDSSENSNRKIKGYSVGRKAEQLAVIQNNNAAEDEYHTWIRSESDILTLQEAMDGSDWDYDEYNPDWTREMARKAIKSGRVRVYSSYPIEKGIFVSPSKMEAEGYSGSGKVYTKIVAVDDVAWIDPTQGQYAPVAKVKGSAVARDSEGRSLSKEQVEYFKDSKVRDENGNLKVMYRGGDEEFTVFDRKKSKYSNLYGRGFYFTDSESHAKQYGKAKPY